MNQRDLLADAKIVVALLEKYVDCKETERYLDMRMEDVTARPEAYRNNVTLLNNIGYLTKFSLFLKALADIEKQISRDMAGTNSSSISEIPH